MGTTSKEHIASGISEIEAINRQEGREALTTGPVFPVCFKNKSKRVWDIWFPHKNERLEPGGEFFRDIVGDPYNIYSRYEKIEFFGQDKPLKFSVRKGWKEPERAFPVVEFLNLHGVPLESTGFRDTVVKMPKGIPILASVDPNWHIAAFKKYTIKLADFTLPAREEIRDTDTVEIMEKSVVSHEGYIDHIKYPKRIKERKIDVHPPVVVQRVQVVLEDPLNVKEMERLKECRKIYSEEAKRFKAVEERF